jgi:hypothetical protein
VLRQAQPLYRECRLILNYFDEKQENSPYQESDRQEANPEWIPHNKDAASTSLTLFEKKRRYGKRIEN